MKNRFLMTSVAVGALMASTGIAGAAGIFDWSGPYLGASIGIVRLHNDSSGLDVYSSTESGPLALVNAGYNIQNGRFVFGVEGDIGASSLDGTSPDPYGGTTTLTMGVTGSVRARAGIAFDRTLLYLTGGIAAAHLRVSDSGDTTPHDSTRVGGVIGGGAEFAMNDNLSLKLEGRYVAFRSETIDNGGPYTSKENAAIGLVGLNFHF